MRPTIGRPLLLVMVVTMASFAGCEDAGPCWEDRLDYHGHRGGGNVRTAWYDVGPVVWNFFCTDEQGGLDEFRFALTLGDGQRFWLEPEHGLVQNTTPVPTYAYTFGSGRVAPLDAGSGHDDLMLGFYNWRNYESGAEDACYRSYNEYSDTRRGRCYEPFFALWNGTNASMAADNPLRPVGTS